MNNKQAGGLGHIIILQRMTDRAIKPN